MPDIFLNAIDRQILEILQKDSSLTNVELARRVHLSPSPCLARVKGLQVTGVIQRYVALLDAEQLNLTMNVFIQLNLERQTDVEHARFQREIVGYPEILECYLMSGDADYLLRVVVAEIGEFEQFVLQRLSRIPGVKNIRSCFALKQVKYETALPLPR